MLEYTGAGWRRAQGVARVDAAWRQREPVQRRLLQDALLAAGARQDRRVQRDLRPFRLWHRHHAGQSFCVQGELVLARNDNDRTQSGDGDPATAGGFTTAAALIRSSAATI